MTRATGMVNALRWRTISIVADGTVPRMDADLWSELEWRGLIKDHTAGLADALRDPVVVYTGFDATAPSLHAGHLIPMMGLHRFQRAGHQPIALVGGGTTLIGDPSGRDTERPLLSLAEIDANVGAIAGQLERFLAGGVKVIDNGEWLRSLKLTEFLRD